MRAGPSNKVCTQEITAVHLFQKILIPPTVCMIFMLVLSVVGYQSLDVQRQAIDELFNTRVKHLQVALRVREGILDVHSRSYRLMTWAGTLDEKTLTADSKALLADADQVIASFGKWAADPGLADSEARLAKDIAAMLIKYKTNAANGLDFALTDDMTLGLTAMKATDESFKMLAALSDELVKVEEKLSQEAFDLSTSTYRRAITVTVAALLAALVLAIGISILITRNITRPVNELLGVTRRLGDGDLTVRIRHSGKDEIGQMLSAQQGLIGKLNAIIGEVKGAADALSNASDQVSATAQSLSQSSSEQAVSVEEATASMEEMTASVTPNTDSEKLPYQMASNSARTSWL